MRFDFVISLSLLLALLFGGAVGAFFLYVPVLTVLSVVTILLGLGLMFALGLLVGNRWRKLSSFSHRSMPIRRMPDNLFIAR